MTILTYTTVFLFGLIIGSFINCLIYRLHEEKSLGGRSFCPKCRHQIAWYDNIPVLSWLLLRAKCRHCRKPISCQYPIVEFITGALFLLVFFINCPNTNCLEITNYKLQITLCRDLLIVSLMIIIFLYDLKYYLILDIITLPSILVIFLLNLLIGISWQNMLISGIIGGSFFLVQFVVSRGKWIGGGDIRLGVLMGVILGWPMVMLAIFLAYILGSVIAIPLLVSGKKHLGSKLPLGIFLAPATLIILFYGQQIWQWYLDTFLYIL